MEETRKVEFRAGVHERVEPVSDDGDVRAVRLSKYDYIIFLAVS